MAERLDTSAPVTTAVLDGQEGQQNWFRSDVEISLDAEDDIFGVDYTFYKKKNLAEKWKNEKCFSNRCCK